MNISIQRNRHVELCAYGLIASGYDLYDRRDAAVVDAVNLIHAAFADATAAKAYFAWARSDDIAVNPYWPRGSGITTAALFIDPRTNRLNLAPYLQHEQRAGSHTAWQDHDYQQWIGQLPDILARIDALKLDAVDAALRTIIQARSTVFQTYIEKTASMLGVFLDNRITLDALVYIPNVLLAPELTDFVHDGTRLYVFATEPRTDSMIHELLHYALHDAIAAISETRLTVLIKHADVIKLQELGYAWDASLESHRRIVEESLVRCVTVLLEHENERIRAEKLHMLQQRGFIVPDTLASFARETITLTKTRAFIATI